jgi:hypothetical protein
MILDANGQPVSSYRKFSRGSENTSNLRPWEPTKLDDIERLITPYDRRTLVSVSRSILENFGPVKGAIRQIAMFSVGDAWKPKNASLSERWRKKAERVIREEFCPIADIRGAGRSFTDLLYHTSILLDRDGEAFILLTEHESGFPALQVIPSHRIRSATPGGTYATQEEVKEGPYRGATISDGVITNKRGTVIAYRYMEDDKVTFTDIPASSLIHCFESDYPESKRGYPSITHGLNDIRDSMQSHEWERLNMLIRSSIALIESNESGVPDDQSPGNHFEGNSSVDEVRATTVRYMEGGAVKHFRAGTGSKIDVLKHENPGNMWSDYNDRMIRMTLSGIPWPVAMVWSATGQGTAERKEIELARRTVKDRQATLRVVAKRCIGYATQKLKKLGRIGESEDWWRWDFNMPPVITIDDGRISKAMLELWRAGVISDEDILSDLGKDEEDYWPRKFDNAVKKEQAFEAAQERGKVTLDPRYKGMFTANDMNPMQQANTPAVKPDAKETDETDQENEDD